MAPAKTANGKAFAALRKAGGIFLPGDVIKIRGSNGILWKSDSIDCPETVCHVHDDDMMLVVHVTQHYAFVLINSITGFVALRNVVRML